MRTQLLAGASALALFLAATALGAERPVPVVQTGLQDGFRKFVSEPNGRYFATVHSRMVKVWDTKTLLEVWSNFEGLGSVAFIRDGTRLVSADYNKEQGARLRVWDFRKDCLDTTLHGGDTVTFKAFTINDRGKRACYLDRMGRIVVLNTRTWKEEKRFHLKRGLKGRLTISPDDKTLAVFARKSTYMVDIETEDVLWTESNSEIGYVFRLRFHPSGKYFFSELKGTQQLEMRDVRTGTKISQVSCPESFGSWCGKPRTLSFTASGNRVYSFRGQLFSWDIEKLTKGAPVEATVHPLSDREMCGVSVGPQEQLIVCFDGHHNLLFVQHATGRILKSVPENRRNYSVVALDSTATRIQFTGGKDSLRYWDLKYGKLKNANLRCGEGIPQKTPFGTFLIPANRTARASFSSCGLERGRVLKFDSANIPIAFMPGSNRLVTNNGWYDSGGVVLWDFLKQKRLCDLKFGRYGGPIAINPRTKVIATGDFDISILSQSGKKLKLLRQILVEETGAFSSTPGAIRDLQWTGKKELRCIHHRGDFAYWDTKKGRAVRTGKIPFYHGSDGIRYSPDSSLILSFSFSPGVAEVFEMNTWKRKYTLQGHIRMLKDAQFGPAGKRLYTIDQFGMVKIWKVCDGSEIASLIPFPPSDYVITLPGGYYMASPGAIKKLAARMDGQVYPFEQFDLKLNRPDLVISALGHADSRLVDAYHRAYLKRLKKMNFTEEMLGDNFALPEVKLFTNHIPTSTPDEMISFDVECKDTSGFLDRINVYVNDVPVYGLGGIDLRALNLSSHKKHIELKLSGGPNKIQVMVLNQRGIESFKETFTVVCTKPEKKPDLFIVAVGVSDYLQDEYDLDYAAKDAQDLAKAFQTDQKAYGQVHVKTVLNSDANRQNILDAKEFLMNSTVDDKVILFVAGHGLLDDNLDYYFATHDVNFEHPSENGLPWENLESVLDGIPARRKLLLVDACHSGEVEKDEVELASAVTLSSSVKSRAVRGIKTKKRNSIGLKNVTNLLQELFADLRRGTGATVITSSSGAQYSFESEKWNNGVFTYAFLEGIRDYKADGDKDKVLKVSEVRDYVCKRVPELTGGKQTPTSRRENLEDDFVVW